MSLPMVLLLACWQRAPGPAPLALAEAPVRLVEERQESAQVTWTVAVRAGSAHDPPGQEGLAWLTAEAIAAGGTQARSRAEVQAELYRLGAAVQVEVGPELVTFSLRCRQASAGACGGLLAELVTTPGLDPAATERARAAARALVDSRSRGPARALSELALARAAWEGHPYGHGVFGRSGSLDALDERQLQAFHRARYVRPAVVLGVLGEPEAADLVATQTALSTLPARLYQDVSPRLLPPVDGRRLLVVEAPVQAPLLLLGHGTDLPPGHPDRVAVQAGLDILGQPQTGPLAQAVADLDVAPMVVGAGLDTQPVRVQPAFRIGLSLPAPDQAGPVLDVVGRAADTLAAYLAVGPDEAALAAWKSRAATALASEQADPSRRLLARMQADLVGEEAPQAELVAALTPAIVQEALARHIDADDLRIVLVTPDATPLRDLSVEGSGAPTVDDGEPPGPDDYGVGLAAMTFISAEELLR